MRALLVAVVLAGVLAGSALGAAGEPRKRHTAAGARTAQTALLRRGDFGKGWTASAPARSASGSSVCKGLRPNLSTLVETGYARSQTFALGQLSTVAQSVRVFASPKQARTAWTRTVSIGLPLCLQKELVAASFAKAKVSPAGIFRLAFAKVASRVAGFRVVVAVHPKDEAPFRVYADVLLVGNGRTISTVTMTGFTQPLGKTLEQRLARVAAARIGARAGLAG